MKRLVALFLLTVSLCMGQEFWDANTFDLPDDTGIYNIKAYGASADGSGGSDDAPAIQAAIDACFGSASSNIDKGTVLFPPGAYSIQSTLVWKRCNYKGFLMNGGTKVLWDGTAAGTMMTFAQADGCCSWGTISGLYFGGGTTEPGIIFQINHLPDSGFDIDHVMFGNFTVAGMDLTAGWWNFHPNDFRCDAYDGWCIKLEPAAGQNKSLASFTNWVADNGETGHDATEGFLYIDLTTNDSSAPAQIELSNGRTEWKAVLIGDSALISIDRFQPNGFSRGIDFVLRNINVNDFTVQDATDTLFHREDDGSSNEVMILQNVFSDTDSITTGSWDINIPVATQNRIPNLTYFGVTGIKAYMAVQNPFSYLGNAASDVGYEAQADGDSTFRFEVQADGRMGWGDGSGATDTHLYRSAPNILKTDDTFDAGAALKIAGGTSIVGHLSATATWDPANLAADGNATSTTITVTGCAVGDPAFASHPGIGTNDALLTAHVESTNTIRLVLMNKTGGALDVATGTARASCWQY